MKIFSCLFLLLLLSASFFACQKESNNNTGQTQTDNLTASAWVHESSFVDLNKNGTYDSGEPTIENLGVPACRLDNTLTFKKDGTAVADEGATKCDNADPQTTSFNWSFADNETSLVISDNVFTTLNGKLKIKTLTNSALTLTKDTAITSPLPLNVTIVVNLKH